MSNLNKLNNYVLLNFFFLINAKYIYSLSLILIFVIAKYIILVVLLRTLVDTKCELLLFVEI